MLRSKASHPERWGWDSGTHVSAARAGFMGGGALGQLARVCALGALRGAGGGNVRAARHAAACADGHRWPCAFLQGLLPWPGTPASTMDTGPEESAALCVLSPLWSLPGRHSSMAYM